MKMAIVWLHNGPKQLQNYVKKWMAFATQDSQGYFHMVSNFITFIPEFFSDHWSPLW